MHTFEVAVFLQYLSSLRPTVILDEEVARDLENEAFKARKHPGIIKPSTISLPPEFINAVDVITQGTKKLALILSNNRMTTSGQYVCNCILASTDLWVVTHFD